MNDFTSFCAQLLHVVSQTLLTEPISYFVGICVLFYIAALVRYMIYGERR